LSQWLWNIACYVEPVVLKHCVLCWASDCESSCVIRSQWLNMIHSHSRSITHHNSHPLDQHNSKWFTATDTVWLTMAHDQWLRQYSHNLVCYRELVVVKHCVLCWPSGSEALCVMLSQWLLIMVCYIEPVVVKHCVLCGAHPLDQHNSKWFTATDTVWLTMAHDQWLRQYSHNLHPLAKHNPQWGTTNGSAYPTVIYKSLLQITHHD
jgi:hypothetical protein